MRRPSRGEALLIVEDDADVREALCDVLEDSGYRCAAACNGREALERLRLGEPPPRAILLDLMMPVMNGWQFRAAQLAESALAPIPVIVLTAVGDIEEKAREMGTRHALSKPVNLPKLLETLSLALAA